MNEQKMRCRVDDECSFQLDGLQDEHIASQWVESGDGYDGLSTPTRTRRGSQREATYSENMFGLVFVIFSEERLSYCWPLTYLLTTLNRINCGSITKKQVHHKFVLMPFSISFN